MAQVHRATNPDVGHDVRTVNKRNLTLSLKHSTLQRGHGSVPFQTPHAYLNVPRNSDVFLTTRVTPHGHGEALFVRSPCSTGKIVPCIENQLMKTSTTNGRHLFHGLDRGVGKTVCQHSGVSIPQLICQSFLR